MKLNLGCGDNILEGYKNYDMYPVDNRVEHIDLDVFPYPFKDNSVDEVLLSHVLEHLKPENKKAVVDEIIRITKKDGAIKIALPTFENGIIHTSYYHDLGYLYSLYSKHKKWSVHDARTYEYSSDTLKLVRIHKHQRCLSDFIGNVKNRFISWLCSFIYRDYEWELKK